MSKPYRHVPRVDAVGAAFEATGSTACKKGNNPYFHPRDCDCQEVRPDSRVTYMEPEPVHPPSRHDALFEGD